MNKCSERITLAGRFLSFVFFRMLLDPQIAQTFSAGFQMTCNIDQVLPANDELGIADNNLTEVRSHFIRDNTPVLADEIEL